ncbi:progranulin isoform X1 [Crotalus tigris]|uniref:progranulin isoform X1 n=1 Tax=Crotalus tigris TaxID=88082 RepID=UPI00192F271E|nr:progranulin isoform X1 [Crotalus tigris]XP_039187332.1 progranulin isoform X1 [Crotalus tigris]XP_039187333.1 progranulin isoform X1 [Crotalus tigris]
MTRMWVHFLIFLVLSRTAFSLQCPDGQKCEGSSTCCKLPKGNKYICCHQPQFTGASLRMLPPESRNEVSGVVCPDASTCPVTHSCQLSLNSTFACCPWEEAVSCADGHHCCPLGTHCSTDGRVCIENEGIWRQDSTSAVIVRAVQCPDSEWECPDGCTCCLMADESWGCCPMPEASCCADKIHCCPHGTTCDLVAARCLETFGEQPLSKKFPAKKRTLASSLTQKNICPGNHSSCPDAATCCLLPTGQYGCCPLQNAVCCSDHLHCCPQGTQCDLKHSICTVTPEGSWPITHLTAGLQTAHDIQCDAKFTCPDGNTCCKITSASWGCCPLEEAVCCPDHTHCCPKGYQCNLSEGTCLKDGQSIPLVSKIDTSSTTASNIDSSSTTASKIDSSSTASSIGQMVQCDPYTACQDGQTCCQLVTGAWGCCLLTRATCCQNQIHCCPTGYICDSSSGTCLKDGDRIPWVEKITAVVGNLPSSKDVKCDDQFSCADGQTCCMHLGAWACCPLFQAVCCEDHQHCCPSGYTCNVAAQSCEKRHWPGPVAAAGGLLTSLQTAASSQDVLCDEQHYCHVGQTCCKAKRGGWACCPYEKGTCCHDRRHCCPSGFYCSLSGFQCYRKKPLRWDTGTISPHSIEAHVLL